MLIVINCSVRPSYSVPQLAQLSLKTQMTMRQLSPHWMYSVIPPRPLPQAVGYIHQPLECQNIYFSPLWSRCSLSCTTVEFNWPVSVSALFRALNGTAKCNFVPFVTALFICLICKHFIHWFKYSEFNLPLSGLLAFFPLSIFPLFHPRSRFASW